MLIICSECGKEYSDQAKSCPHCGAITAKNRYIQGYARRNYSQENNKGLAIAGFAVGVISLFFLPILEILTIIFGAIAIGTNENNESWNKSVWQYKNKALGFGRCSLMIGIIDVIWMIANYYMLMSEFTKSY